MLYLSPSSLADPHPGAGTVYGGPLSLMGRTVSSPSEVARCSYSTWWTDVLNGEHSVSPIRFVSDPHPEAVTVYRGPLSLMGGTVSSTSEVARCSYSTWGATVLNWEHSVPPPSDAVSDSPSRCSYSIWGTAVLNGGAQCPPLQK